MTAADRERWDAKYAQQLIPDELIPPEWLIRHAADLAPGRALELATGHGHAAIWLAERGWNVTAIDISQVGLQAARQLADRRGAIVNWLAADLDQVELGTDVFDLVTVFRYLDRSTLPPRITCSLRTGGCLIYQTFLRPDETAVAAHPQNRAFLLESGELPRLFPEFEILCHQEQQFATGWMSGIMARKT